ncbi:twin-arginine translocase TatA/TatE family subunit [Streptomyces sp. NBC_01689]|nr:Sec-independent protein translocase TatA [Streptomyces sp. me109]
MFGMSELTVILLVVVVVLGIRKLPELTRSAGRAARIFKSESRALKDQRTTDGAAGPGRVVRGTVVDGEAPRPRP